MEMSFVPMEEFFNSEVIDYTGSGKYNMWLKTPDGIFPSMDSEIWGEIKPGYYRPCFSRDSGYYLMPLGIKSDELYVFKDSKLPKVIGAVDSFWERKESFEGSQFLHKMGILLYGPPGTGKSSLITLLICRILERKSGIVLAVDNDDDLQILTSFLPILKQVNPNMNITVIIEGIEKLRSNELLLNFLDGKKSTKNQLVIGTANDLSEVQNSLLRPGRFDKRLLIDKISEESKREYLDKFNLSEEEIENYMKSTEGFSFAEIRTLIFSTKFLGLDLDETIEELGETIEKIDYNEVFGEKHNIGFNL